MMLTPTLALVLDHQSGDRSGEPDLAGALTNPLHLNTT
jgi:hypothetical protein